MISTIIKQYKNTRLEIEVEYTGPETIDVIIDKDTYSVLPVNSIEENYTTLSLPDDFEKMCFVYNSINILSVSPSTIEFDNGKIIEIYIPNIQKYLAVDDYQLVVKDFDETSTEQFLMGLESYKTITQERLADATDNVLISKLEHLLSEIEFVISSTMSDENFPYMLYAFDVV